MTICTRVARNGLSYSGSTERASRPRCVQTFLMATRNRAPVLFPLSSPFFPFLFSFYLSRYDHLVTTLLNERSSRILPSSRSKLEQMRALWMYSRRFFPEWKIHVIQMTRWKRKYVRCCQFFAHLPLKRFYNRISLTDKICLDEE